MRQASLATNFSKHTAPLYQSEPAGFQKPGADQKGPPPHHGLRIQCWLNVRIYDRGELGSVADPERFHADPDPTFQADAAPDTDPKFCS